MTACSSKGTARFYDEEVNGKRNSTAAWYYHEPKEAASQIRDYADFWNGVKVAPYVEPVPRAGFSEPKTSLLQRHEL